MPTTRLVAPAVVAVVAAGLAACSTGPTGSTGSGGSTGASATGTSTSPSGADQAAFPVTIKDHFGSTTITKRPTRIATVGWSDQDFLVSLGVVPVGAPSITWGGNAEHSTDWFDSALTRLHGKQPTRYDDQAGVPVDAIAKLAPDLILGTNSGMTAAEHAKLSKIAPVVAFPDKPWGTSWSTSLAMIGKAVGEPAKAAALTQQTNRDIDAAVAKYPQIKGKSAAWAWFTPTDLSKIGVYTALDNRLQMLARFGFTTPSFVTKLSQQSPNAYSGEISSEKAPTVAADVLVFYVDNPAQTAELTRNALISRIPAIQRGSYVASADNAAALPMSSPTTLSIPVALRTFLPRLAAAAAK